MDRKPLDKELDEWLDAALAHWGRVEARPGLEERTVACLQDRVSRRAWLPRGARPLWVSAAAITIVVFMVVIFARQEKPANPVVPQISDHELLLGVDRLLSKEVPAAFEPGLVLTREIARK